MIKLMVMALCAGFIGSAVAAEDGQAEQSNAPAQMVTPPPASAPAAATQTAPAAGAPQAPNAAAQPASAEAPKSGISPEKRQGADATKCLELKSDREIAACAEKFRRP